MKHLLILCIALLYTTFSWGIDIKFIKAEEGPDLRSVVIAPTAAYEGNVISISSKITMPNIQVAVKDIAGNIVYSNIVAIPANQQYSFALDNAENGEYVLEVTYGDKLFYGYFAL